MLSDFTLKGVEHPARHYSVTRRFRPGVVWLHRWIGLLMAIFFIVVGLTGSLLAFNTQLEQWLNPEIFAQAPAPNAKQLDLATLADRAEAEEPKIHVSYYSLEPQRVYMHVLPRVDQTTGKPFQVDFDQMFLDPWTGKELGRRKAGDLAQGKINVMPFIYSLHTSMAMGDIGTWALGIVALAWTIDCFFAFYLTFPIVLHQFLIKWKLAWQIKLPSSNYRVHFDAHRASGLWFTPLLFIFAWSSVMFNLEPVYDSTMRTLFDYQSPTEEFSTLGKSHPTETPRLNWHDALQRSEQVLNEIAQKEGFTIDKPYGFAYISDLGVYSYSVESSRNISIGNWEGVGVWVDGQTGELQKVFYPNGEHTGNTITHWLRTLHFGNLYGWLSYRILVCLVGLVIVLLSWTGIYIWWKKRSARIRVGR